MTPLPVAAPKAHALSAYTARPGMFSLKSLPRALLLAALTTAGSSAHAAGGPGGTNTGGNWYGSLCSAGSPGGTYAGACSTGGDTLEGHHLFIVEDSDNVIGADSLDRSLVIRNTVFIQSGTINYSVAGGYSLYGHAISNTATMQGGTVNAQPNGGGYFGGYSYSGNAISNTATIQGGTIKTTVFGGHSQGGNAVSNTATIQDGTVDGSLLGGYSVYGQAISNTATVAGGSIGGNIIGGHNQAGDAISNTVTIIGGSIGGNIIGGQSTIGNAIGNRVILLGAADISNSTLYGGQSTSGLSADNTLEVRSVGWTAQNTVDFQNYHFILPGNMAAGGTMLTLTAGPTDISGAQVGVAMTGLNPVLQTGDRVTLIHNANGLTADSTITRADMSAYQGISLRYTFDLSSDSNNLYATSTGRTITEQTKAPVEARASAMSIISQGADLASGAGMAHALAATAPDAGSSATGAGGGAGGNGNGIAAFGAMSGDSSRYHTGSHVDTEGYGFMLGAAKRFPAAAGQWLAGLFVEAGYGNYDTYNDIAGQPTVRGGGHSRYVGGGALLRRDWATDGLGPYAEGSLRVGRISSDWGSRTMLGADHASYDTASMYYGAHLGAGYVLSLNDRTSLDTYVKGFWTHQDSDSVTIAGDPYEFKAMDSFRTRLGMRLNRTLTEQITAYVGAAWEHEYDGKARATTYGFDTPSPSLKGDTGVFELGLDMKPKATGPLTVSLGVQAYTGMREGFGGTAKLSWVY